MRWRSFFSGLSTPLSFRDALAAAAALILAALIAMAALTALALAKADRLLDRLSHSQDQLARVVSLEADINALLLASAEGADPAVLARAVADIDAQIRSYVGAIAAERAVIGDDPDTLARQADEMQRGRELADLIAAFGAAISAESDEIRVVNAVRSQTTAKKKVAGARKAPSKKVTKAKAAPKT